MYAKLGANVVVNDMSKENAESVVAEIKKGKSSVVVPCIFESTSKSNIDC